MSGSSKDAGLQLKALLQIPGTQVFETKKITNNASIVL